jgi:protein-tyrosine phosphatase
MGRKLRRRKSKTWKSTRQQYNGTVSTLDLVNTKSNYQRSLDFDGSELQTFQKNKTFKLAFRHGDRYFWGGPDSDISVKCWDAVISLREHNKLFVTDSYVPRAGKVVRFIAIPWDNNDAAFLTIDQWESIINKLPDKGDIAVCCFGGRGRTGTALAILRALITGDKSDPVLAIRNSYSQYAIESDIQIRYIERITRLDSVCGGSNNGIYNYCYPFDDFYGNYDGNLDESADSITETDERMEQNSHRKLRGLAQARTY